MARIVIDIPGETPYEVHIAQGLVDNLGARIRMFDQDNSKVVVVTDTAVAPLYLDRVKTSLAQAQYEVHEIVVPSGEGAKSLSVAGDLWDSFASMHLDRNALVVALGGGVVGDLAGFVGSTFMRGLRIVQVPTTLLSMVDSSVGGKTAINLSAGKNLVGTFCQPVHVCADTDLLGSLPEREWLCGCGEIAKSAVIDSDDFYFWLWDHAYDLRKRNHEVVAEAVKRSVSFKARVVVQDKQETLGVRECLNYGHTLAHAIENAAGYGTYSHGAAVAQGMRFAARLGAATLGTSLEFVRSQDELLDKLGLVELDFDADPEQLLSLMMSDKKVRNGRLRFVLPQDVESWVVKTLPPEVVLEHLRAWQIRD